MKTGLMPILQRHPLLDEMDAAIRKQDWYAEHAVLMQVYALDDATAQVDVFNQLLVLPGHKQHQEVCRAIQGLASPSSVPWLRWMLAEGFPMLAYTYSEPGVIAKWFSHALADIGTVEAIAVISEFAKASDPDIAAEMTNRLQRMQERGIAV